jgi:hypothetical protein
MADGDSKRGSRSRSRNRPKHSGRGGTGAPKAGAGTAPRRWKHYAARDATLRSPQLRPCSRVSSSDCAKRPPLSSPDANRPQPPSPAPPPIHPQMGYAGYVSAKYPPPKPSEVEAAVQAIKSEAALDVIGKLLYNAAISPREEKFRCVFAALRGAYGAAHRRPHRSPHAASEGAGAGRGSTKSCDPHAGRRNGDAASNAVLAHDASVFTSPPPPRLPKPHQADPHSPPPPAATSPFPPTPQPHQADQL